jgi:nicotinamide-nucleotide amidase
MTRNNKENQRTDLLDVRVGEVLSAKGISLAVAESCTGGLIAHRVTNVPGSSRYFVLGVVAYSNEPKVRLLGVDPRLIEQHGAVSREVAIAMARGVSNVAGSDIGVGVTGIAGPEGGTPEKPVGLVFIAAVRHNREKVERHVFSGTRAAIKRQSSDTALRLITDLAQE